MTLEQEKKPVLNQRQAILAEKRAAALRANLKKRKDQTANRNNKEETLDE
jgi:hypothetical protein